MISLPNKLVYQKSFVGFFGFFFIPFESLVYIFLVAFRHVFCSISVFMKWKRMTLVSSFPRKNFLAFVWKSSYYAMLGSLCKCLAVLWVLQLQVLNATIRLNHWLCAQRIKGYFSVSVSRLFPPDFSMLYSLLHPFSTLVSISFAFSAYASCLHKQYKMLLATDYLFWLQDNGGLLQQLQVAFT